MKKPKTVLEIIKKYLKENGYDGLCCPEVECGCHRDNLGPCGCEGIAECFPGYIRTDENGEWGIYLKKSKKK